VQASAAVQAAAGRYVQAGLYPNPSVGYTGGDIGLEDTSGQQGVTISQEFVTRGKLRLARAVAGHEINRARYGMDAQQQRVVNDVRTGYYEVLLAQETVKVNERLVEISARVVRVNEQLRAQQEVSRPVLLQSRIEANGARLSLIAARKAYDAAWRRLATVVGQPELDFGPVAGNPYERLPEFTWEAAREQILSRSPQLSQAYVGVQRAQCELARQRANAWPNIRVGSWIKYDGPTQDPIGDVSVGIPLPIFDRNQGGISEAYAALVAAEREVDRVRLNLLNQLATAFQRYDVAFRQVRIYTNSIVPDARQSLELASAGYREGEFGYLDLLIAQVTYFNASLNMLSQLQELWASSIQLEGLLLSGGLASLQ
jgi:cobalt-zinc-cadmium efflux system outer membrane protein